MTGLLLPLLLGGRLCIGVDDAVGILFCDAVALNPGRVEVGMVAVGVDFPPCKPGLKIGEVKGNGGAGERAREDEAETPDLNDVELSLERRLGLTSPVVEVPGPVLLPAPALARGVRPVPVPVWAMELGSTLARIRVGGMEGEDIRPGEGAGDEVEDEIAVCPVT